MKRIIRVLIITFLLFFTTNAYASSFSLAVSSNKVTVGSNFTVSVNVTAAAW